MSSVKDLLSNPGSSRFYLNRRYYYAIGNTPSVDLTEGCQVPRHTKFLLLGCGDIRNILQTVHELSQLKPQAKSLTFYLNDIDDVLLARNAVLLQIINIIDPSKRKDVEFLWNVWYNLHLSEDDFERLKMVLSQILDDTSVSSAFGSDECSTAVKDVVKYWLNMKIDVQEARSQRERFICQKLEANSKLNAEVKFSDAADALFVNAGFLPGPLNEHDREEVETYFYNGSTDDDSSGRTNPTFFCPHISGWRVHPSSLPYRAFRRLRYTFEDKLSVKDNCILQLQSQLASWKTYTKSGAIKVSLWDGDALTLCYSRMPCGMKFHFINASNLCDHITLLDVLLACSGRLDRNGLLAVQTMHLVDDRGFDGSVERYLEAELGFSANFFPTFLGLHLAEDFELGTSDTSATIISFSFGCHELTTRWIAAEPSSPILSVEDSPEIKKVFEEITRACFSMFGPEVKSSLNTPLTLIYLMRQLSTKLDRGVMPLLEIAERCLPTESTKSGLTFRPLEMEWKMLTQYFFPDQAATNGEDEVVKVQVPVRINILMPRISKAPAGLDVQHRAVLRQDFYEPLDVLQKQYNKPWHILTVMEFDHMTNTVTCVLKRSDLRSFGEHAYLQFFLPQGLPSTLVTTGPFISIISYGEYIHIENNSPCATKSQTPPKRQESDVKLILRETRSAYAMTLTAASQKTCIQSFKVRVDPTAKMAVDVILKIRNENGTDTVEKQICLSHPVELPVQKRYGGKETVTFTKSLDKGPLILPLLRVNISEFPRYTTEKKQFILLLEGMFTSEEDQKLRNKDSTSQSPLLQVKETIQIILLWAIEPPPTKPLVRAYRIKKKHTEDQQCGYFPEDIFIGVRNLHSVRGIPTLDVVWLDFEPYREMSELPSGMLCPDAEIFLLANGGMIPETCHVISVSVEESKLLKKILRLNTKRSIQKSDELGSSRWRFNSFIQPVYSVTAEIDLRKNAFSKTKILSAKRVLSNVGDAMADKQQKCHSCSQLAFNAKKCTGCKSVSYCSKECQRRDWIAGHKLICRVKPDNLQTQQDTENHLQTCAYCGTCRTGMKKCSRCKAVFYCSKDCQKKDWKTAHKLTCSEHKSDAKGKH